MDSVAGMSDASVAASTGRAAVPRSLTGGRVPPMLPPGPQLWEGWLARATSSGCDEGFISLAT